MQVNSICASGTSEVEKKDEVSELRWIKWMPLNVIIIFFGILPQFGVLQFRIKFVVHNNKEQYENETKKNMWNKWPLD